MIEKKYLVVALIILSVFLLEAGSISGSIAVENGETFGSDITLYRLPNLNNVYQMGHFTVPGLYGFYGLPAGDYILHITPYTSQYLPHYYPGVPSPEAAEIITLDNPQSNVTGIDFYLEQGTGQETCLLSGSVSDENGLGIEELEVYLYGIFGNYWNSYMVETDEAGFFEFSEIAAGSYILFLEYVAGYEHYFWEDGANFYEADPIFMEPGDVITGLELELEPAENFTIAGNVWENDEGVLYPLENALVSGYAINCWGEGEYFLTLTDEYGNYEVETAGGYYWLYSTTGDYTEQYWNHVSVFNEAEPLAVNQNLEDIDFTLEALTEPADNSISGNITLNGGEPGFPCMVIVIASDDDDDWSETTISESSGYYYIDEIPAGNYYVVMLTSTTPPVYYPEGYDWENAQEVYIEGNVNGIDFALQEIVQDGVILVDGYIYDTEREPVCGAAVVFFDEDNYPVSYGISDSEGHYEAAGISGGNYSAVISKTFYNSSSTNISLTENEEIDFELEYYNTDNEYEEIEPVSNKIVCYPNPFYISQERGMISISFTPESAGTYNLSVFNLRGQLTDTIYSGWLDKQSVTFFWDGSNGEQKSSSGIYLLGLEREGKLETTEKVLILK